MESMLAQYHPQDCVKCQKCSKSCPSSRNGGIVPHLVVEAVNQGKEPSDVWKCLQCHRCSDTCPNGIKVSEIILFYRSRIEMPEKMKKTYDIVEKHGRAVVPSPMAKSQRQELGLQVDEISEGTLSKVKGYLEGVR